MLNQGYLEWAHVELRGNGADRKFALAWLAGFSLFDSSLTTHPVLLFSDTDFTLIRRVISRYPLSRSFASSGKSKGRPFPAWSLVRPISLCTSCRRHLCPKKMVRSAGHSSGGRMRVKVIAADNCAFPASNGGSYMYFISLSFYVHKAVKTTWDVEQFNWCRCLNKFYQSLFFTNYMKSAKSIYLIHL